MGLASVYSHYGLYSKAVLESGCGYLLWRTLAILKFSLRYCPLFHSPVAAYSFSGPVIDWISLCEMPLIVTTSLLLLLDQDAEPARTFIVRPHELEAFQGSSRRL